MGVKIKDAELVKEVTGEERIPVSDGSGQPKAMTTEQMKGFVGANYATKKYVTDVIQQAITTTLNTEV